MAIAEPTLRIVEDDLAGGAVQVLLRHHAEGMLATSPPGACHFLDLDTLRQPDVTMWTVWDGDDLAGCGALRELSPEHGEVKSMRTADDHLGRGVGAAVLTQILDTARERGYRWVSLETGTGPAFEPARRLYSRFGFVETGPFAGYPASEFSRFMALQLAR